MSNLIYGFQEKNLLLSAAALGTAATICGVGGAALGYTGIGVTALVTAFALPAIAAIGLVYLSNPHPDDNISFIMALLPSSLALVATAVKSASLESMGEIAKSHETLTGGFSAAIGTAIVMLSFMTASNHCSFIPKN